jgi:hypothetical protein
MGPLIVAMLRVVGFPLLAKVGARGLVLGFESRPAMVKTPNGTVLWPDVHEWGMKGVFPLVTPLRAGDYEVSW